MDSEEIRWKGVGWVYLLRIGTIDGAVVITVMNFPFQ
jgi:hypothetical protein